MSTWVLRRWGEMARAGSLGPDDFSELPHETRRKSDEIEAARRGTCIASA
jgi:hypothetical protein